MDKGDWKVGRSVGRFGSSDVREKGKECADDAGGDLQSPAKASEGGRDAMVEEKKAGNGDRLGGFRVLLVAWEHWGARCRPPKGPAERP